MRNRPPIYLDVATVDLMVVIRTLLSEHRRLTSAWGRTRYERPSWLSCVGEPLKRNVGLLFPSQGKTCNCQQRQSCLCLRSLFLSLPLTTLNVAIRSSGTTAITIWHKNIRVLKSSSSFGLTK